MYFYEDLSRNREDNALENLSVLKKLCYNIIKLDTRHSTGKKIYRIPLETDYRIFTPVARDSKKFKNKYKMRTEIERLNGRIDRDYMFNDHFIRGQKKMELMLNLTFIVMLTMAKGHINLQFYIICVIIYVCSKICK